MEQEIDRGMETERHREEQKEGGNKGTRKGYGMEVKIGKWMTGEGRNTRERQRDG